MEQKSNSKALILLLTVVLLVIGIAPAMALADGEALPAVGNTELAAATVNRMLGRAADKDYVDGHLAELTHFSDVSQSFWAYYDICEAVNGYEYQRDDGAGESWTGIK